jgi:hypothetical protein
MDEYGKSLTSLISLTEQLAHRCELVAQREVGLRIDHLALAKDFPETISSVSVANRRVPRIFRAGAGWFGDSFGP